MTKPAKSRGGFLNIQESNGIITTMKIEIYYKSVYGVRRAYPVCQKAKLFQALCRSKTLLDSDLKIIRELGFEIVELADIDEVIEDD